MWKYILVGVLAIGILSVGVRVATLALFTDTQSVGANTFTTGTVDIVASPSTALLTNVSMAPGDRVTNPITITNSGSLQLRYAIQRAADNADGKGLGAALKLRVGLRGGAGCDFPYHNADGTTTTLSDDTQLYEGLGIPATATDTVGDDLQGSQAGDRALAAAANEVLCFGVVLPSTAGNSLQGATTTASFDFVSEQTANNP